MKKKETIKLVWFEWRNGNKRIEREIERGDINAYNMAQLEANLSQVLDTAWNTEEFYKKNKLIGLL